MNRVIVTLLACLAFVVLGVSSLHAQAEVRRDGCRLLSVDSDGNLVLPPLLVEGQAVQAANTGGNTLILCRGQLPHSVSKQVTLDFASTEAAIGTGLYCFSPFGGEPTQNWQQVITPSGQATLTCHYNPSSNQ